MNYSILVRRSTCWALLALIASASPSNAADEPAITSVVGSATLVLYRGPHGVDGFGPVDISINGVPQGELSRRSVLTLHVQPGPIEIEVRTPFRANTLTVQTVAGETGYVLAWQSEGAPPFAIPGTARFSLKVVSQETGQKDTIGLKNVAPATVVDNTSSPMSEHVAIPTDDGDATRHGDVSWFPGLGELRISSYTKALKSARHGSLTLTQHMLTLLERPDSPGSSSGSGLQMQFSEIQSVEVQHLFINVLAILHYRGGHTDAFQVSKAGAGKETEAAAAFIQSRLGGTL
jgi:hypothetical protein